jgi:hypothetical protein
VGFFDRFRRTPPSPHSAPVVWTRETVVPLVREWGGLSRLEKTAGRTLSKRHVAADLWVIFARYSPSLAEFLVDGEEDYLVGVKGEELYEVARDNLRTRMPPVQRHGKVGAEMLTCGGKFEASLLLFEDLWESIAGETSGDLVACVPSRDTVLLTGTAVPGGVERLRSAAQRILGENAHPLSGALLRWTGDGWEPFAPAA